MFLMRYGQLKIKEMEDLNHKQFKVIWVLRRGNATVILWLVIPTMVTLRSASSPSQHLQKKIWGVEVGFFSTSGF